MEYLLEPLQRDGIFPCIDQRTGQYIINGTDGIKCAWTILRLPDDEKWKCDDVEKVRVTPYKLHQPSEPAVSFREPASLPGVLPPDQISA